MCDFSGKLIAWMDGELSEGEAGTTEAHVEACADCRSRLEVFRQVSDGFAAYCDAAIALAGPQPKISRWMFAVAGATAALALLLVLLPKRSAQTPQPTNRHSAVAVGTATSAAEVRPPAATAPGLSASRPQRIPAKAPEPASTVNAVQRVVTARAPVRSVESAPAEPSVEIAIPVDAMFPPGAVPPGMSFTAELIVSADGSAEQLGLRPCLAGFERRKDQP
jgi:hypothetical protein